MFGKRHPKTGFQNDLAVQGTNDSSIVSKCSMASLGYFQDDYLKHFVSKMSRRAPLINRGYFIRAKAIDDLLRAFLMHYGNESNQIISFGAGFDSTYFRLEANGSLPNTVFYEVDFPQLVKRKSGLIRNNTQLGDLLQNQVFHDSDGDHSFGVCISSDKYHLLGVDLKQLDTLQDVFNQAGLNFTSPTLLLSECVITYIDTASSDALISWAAKSFTNSAFISYEQVLPHDPFGIVMQRHFQKLNSPLNAIQTYSTMEKHRSRFIDQGWQSSDVVNMHQYYSQVLALEERRRVEKIELFDEFEEWHLKCVHYVVVAAFNGTCASAKQELFPDIPVTPQLAAEQLDGCGSGPLTVKPLQLQPTSDSQAWLRLFSHASAQVPGTQKVIITGGFGDEKGCHRRLDLVQILDLRLNQLTEIQASEGSERLGPRMHHTITALSSNRFLIFGGRTSPAKPCTVPVVLTLLDSNQQLQFSLHRLRCSEGGCAPTPGWRHTATAVEVEGKEAVLVYGGRGVDGQPLSDNWLLDVGELTWSKICFDGHKLEPKHSHTATQWRGSRVVVAGGLGHDTAPLNSLAILDMESRTCEELETVPPFQARYSHTAHIVEDQLILLGGENPLKSALPSVTVVHLKSFALQNFSLEVFSPESPIMLHNHASHWLAETESILVIGGGGNCFSFGTHLNKTPVIIEGTLHDSVR